jgi:hypothetical protein
MQGGSSTGLNLLETEAVENALPGILISSSGQGESRGDQGLRQIHDRLVTAGMSQGAFGPGRTIRQGSRSYALPVGPILLTKMSSATSGSMASSVSSNLRQKAG